MYIISFFTSSVLFLIITPFQKLGAFYQLMSKLIDFDRVFFLSIYKKKYVFSTKILLRLAFGDFWDYIRYPYQPIYYLGKHSIPLNFKTLIKYF